MVAVKIIAIMYGEWDLEWIHGKVREGLTAVPVVTSL